MNDFEKGVVNPQELFFSLDRFYPFSSQNDDAKIEQPTFLISLRPFSYS